MRLMFLMVRLAESVTAALTMLTMIKTALVLGAVYL